LDFYISVKIYSQLAVEKVQF